MWILALAVTLFLLPLILFGLANTYYGVRFRLPYAPSSTHAVRTMLEHGHVRKDSVVLDLGSGTGDILIAAARMGAHAVGIEINPFLVWFTRLRARYLGLSTLITVTRGDMFTVKLPSADVVTMYLPSKKTEELRDKLIAELPKHALIISHGFSMPGWKAYAGTESIHVYRVLDLA